MNQIFDYLKDGAFTILISAPIYFLIRWLIVHCTGQRTKLSREIMLAVFSLFVVWLASETVLPEFSVERNELGRLHFVLQPSFHIGALERLETGYMMNFVPFETMRRYTSFADFGSSVVNLVGNVVMFLPLGFLPPLLWKGMRKFWKIAVLGAGSSCLIEFIQVFIDRSVDIDDVILNTAGVLLGYLLLLLVFLLFPKLKNTGVKCETV